MNQSDFAKLHNVSRKTVTAWKARGWLVLAGDDIDVEASNANIERFRKTVTRPEKKVAGNTQGNKAGNKTGNRAKGNRSGNRPDKDPVDSPADVVKEMIAESGVEMTIDEAREMKENFLALLTRLEYDIKSGQVLPYKEMIEAVPSDFSLSLMDLYPGSDNQQWVNPGDACVVNLGDDVVLTGYIDRWAPMISRNRREVRATGRSKCQDLVDCSAEWPNNVISQSTALQIAQRLAMPYGITVSSDVTNLDIVPQFTLNWGESSQEIIDRITRWAALLYYDLPDGSLYLTRVGTRKAASGVAKGINIEDAAYNSGMDQRFSDYIGVSMSVSQLQEQVQDAGYGSVTLARSRDPEAAQMRYRNRIIIVESTMKALKLAQQCIDWEMNRRYGRSKELLVTVDNWRDKDGKLWEPNTLIPIDLPIFGLKDELWLLSEVTYLKDDHGTAAQMVLMPPEAFTVQPYQFYSNLMELNQR